MPGQRQPAPAGQGPSRQQRDNNPRLLSPAQPSHAGLGTQCKRASSLCISLHLPPPLGLSLRRGKGQWHLGSVPQAAPRVPLPCATSLTQPLCTNTFTCVLLLRGRGACPITTTPQSPCPDRGQPSCSSRACPGPLPHSGHVPGQLGHCNAPVQEAQAVLSPPGHPRGAASCPIPDRLGPAVGALVNKAFPVHGGHGQWQSLVPAGSSLCSTH